MKDTLKQLTPKFFRPMTGVHNSVFLTAETVRQTLGTVAGPASPHANKANLQLKATVLAQAKKCEPNPACSHSQSY